MTLIGSVPTGMSSAQTGGELRLPKSILEEYLEALGNIWSSLQSLEIALRQFLFSQEVAAPFLDLEALSLGVAVPENALTDYSPLDGLIGRYNRAVTAKDRKLRLAKDPIVALRNALGHGRVLSKTGAPPFRLVTFSKPREGQVKVKMVAVLDAEWLQTQQHLVTAARAAVAKAAG